MYKYLKIKDFYLLFKPTGPVFAYTFPWLLVLFLQQLALCGIIVSTYSPFYLVILGNLLTSILGACFLQLLLGKTSEFTQDSWNELKISNYFKKVTYFFVSFILLSQIFQFIYFNGFPLLWLIQGSGKSYMEYGIRSINGLLNAIYLLSTTAFYLIYLKERKGWKLIIILFLFLFPILIISRQLIISLFIQIACCSLICNPKHIKKFIWAGIFILMTFVFLGNLRTGLTHLVEILQPQPYIPTWAYSLLWIYAYVVTPFNNVNAAVENINPIGAPLFELSPLLPSIFRDIIQIDINSTGFSLVHANMNVSTFYLFPILDFGCFYAFGFMFFIQILLFFAFRKATKTKQPIHVIEYAILYMIIFLSIFDNLFLFLPVITQLVFINLAKIRFMRRYRVWGLGWGVN